MAFNFEDFQEETAPNKELLMAHLSMEETLKLLKGDFNPEKTCYEITIIGDITAGQIKELTLLNFEVEITEKFGKPVLTTGEKNSTKGVDDNYASYYRVINSDLSFHTHPILKDHGGPSFPDLITASLRKNKKPSLIAHIGGITIYQKPQINPLTNEQYTGDPRDLILIYSRACKIDISGMSKDENLRKWNDLTIEEKIAFENDFAEKSGAIIREIPWEDEEGIKEAMDYINLKKD